MAAHSRTITVSVKSKTGDVFDAILNMPPKIMPDAKKTEDGSWKFTTEHGPAQLKFNENKSLGILDHQFIEETAKWNVPMRVVSSGDYSEIIVTLFKPDTLSEDEFIVRTKEMEKIMENMKEIIERP